MFSYATVFVLAVVFTTAAYATDCPSECGSLHRAQAQCLNKPGCKLISCTFDHPDTGVTRGRSCVPDTPPVDTPCPDRCIDPTWAEEKCKGLTNCQVIPCDRDVKGKTRPGARCAPKPVEGDCPEKCIDPRWAQEKCDLLSNCEVVPCERDVHGKKRPGAQCVPKSTGCPNKCIDPTWAAEKCKPLSGCKVVPCDRDVKGETKPGASCVDESTPEECPEKCIDPVWAEEQCKLLSGCEVVPCVRDVKGTGKLRDGATCTAKKH